MHKTCFKGVTLFPDECLEKCKNNPNVPRNIYSYEGKSLYYYRGTGIEVFCIYK